MYMYKILITFRYTMFDLSIYHFLYVVNGLQQLQQRRCQMKRIGKMPHRAGRVKSDDCRHITTRLTSAFEPFYLMGRIGFILH
jgi:hypothetical protein